MIYLFSSRHGHRAFRALDLFIEISGLVVYYLLYFYDTLIVAAVN
jgi:hypothetical protein